MLKHLQFTFSIAFLLLANLSSAQNLDQPGAYLTYMSEQYRGITEDFWSYTSAVAHGKSARKVENRRAELLKTVKDASKKISLMPAYKGDKSLRDSAVAYLNLTYHILNDDYGKIVNMEEVAEQSYDAMEAYYLAQDLAGEKQEKASKSLHDNQMDFAKKYNVNVIDSEQDELSKKVEAAGKVSAYHRVIYLIFFKSYKQEVYLMDAANKKNVAGIEQNRKTLLQFSEEGIAKLDTMKAFNGDRSLVLACKQMLEFYKKECKEKFAIYTNYYMKTETFEKTKKAFDAKKQSDRTQADVDQFNKAVKEYNDSVNQFNQVNNELNQNRATLLDNYNNSSSKFLDKHTPKYK